MFNCYVYIIDYKNNILNLKYPCFILCSKNFIKSYTDELEI